MKKIIAFVFLSFFVFVASCNFFEPLHEIATYEAKITAVVDGDTIKIQFADKIPAGCARSETVRLIGVNTPELKTKPPEYYAKEARDFVNQYYLSVVHIETDPDTAFRDKYGRLLAYVYIDFYSQNSILLNKKLIEDGYGYYYGTFTFNRQNMYEFKNAEDDARYLRKGLWQ